MTLFACAPPAQSQVGAKLSGIVFDPSSAVISGATVTTKNFDTGFTRTSVSNAAGRYDFFSLPLGHYEVRATKTGFAEEVRTGISLVVGEEAIVDLHLGIGATSEKITVTGSASSVSATAQDISGLVGERQIKDLPLNGRSYDLLMTLNPGVVNFTSEKTGGIGVSNSATGNNFSVSGNRPQQNIFLINGVEYTGAAENNMQPGGSSQQLLGIDGVREFNVLRDSYDATYGKHPGGQVVIVTQSGTNGFHGSAFEFLRNNILDAPNFFDQGDAPPFHRNQFGGALGGPLAKDKTFLFANYEGFRQSLHQTSAAFVPDLASRAKAVPSVVPLLHLWPTPRASDPDFNGIAEVFSSPLQTIREDFGTVRLDHMISNQDSATAAYTIDDGGDVTATVADPFSSDILDLREQVLSLEENHTSSGFANTVRFGFSRAGYFFTGEPTPGTPAASVAGFLAGRQVGAVVVGGSAASNPQAQVGLAGSNNGSNLHIARNLFSVEDRFAFTRGRHQITLGMWLQPFQSNETIALSQFGQATFTSLQTFLQGTIGGFLFDPKPSEMNWRSLFGAWYLQDAMRLTPRLTVSLGFRSEFSTGWNEAHGRAADYTFTNGVISSQPHIGNSLFTTNNARFLAEPRVGIAWSPWGTKTIVRAGFGIYNDLQDALGYRADQNAPFNPVYNVANLSVSSLPINPSAPAPNNALLVPGGVQPDMKTPTLLSYSLRIERELSSATTLTVGYVGSHGYHELIGLDANEPFPVICPASPCPAVYPATFPAPLAGQPVPAGIFFVPTTAKANPTIANTWTWFSLGTSYYNALQVDVKHRFAGSLALRGVYTWSKALDDGDSLNQTTAGNAPGLVSNPFNLRADWGPATYDVRNAGVVSATWDLPVGRGHCYLNDASGALQAILGGWSINGILAAQSGFPFTPQLSYNPSNNGDTRNPVRPFVNPAFTGSAITGNPAQWFNPAAFLQPPPNSGFYGNLRRNSLVGPGLSNWDQSFVKNTNVRESLDLQLRAEIFNLPNRANFGTPNLIVFTPSGLSGTAGAITSTSTSSRQVQFGLKLLW
ncbi:MAG TPA: carboxypeptidase-like regulatory domain-containing protein [Terriglobales bacterium]|nr:carboxypeptidase-like regulatory domain-containing protein [Terriglobales bacterium]